MHIYRNRKEKMGVGMNIMFQLDWGGEGELVWLVQGFSGVIAVEREDWHGRMEGTTGSVISRPTLRACSVGGIVTSFL